jgi:inosine-uridine nucleoside N-ribohydrolase
VREQDGRLPGRRLRPRTVTATRELWIDTDVALGARSWRARDVDDAWAIAALLRAPGVRLRGLSTVFGNTSAGDAARCARALLAIAGARLDVIAGATRAQQDSAAAQAIAALPDGTHLLALGPLTNVAAALTRDPSLAARVTVYVVGGNLSTLGRWPPWWPFEFNLALDDAAARAVFASGMRVRLYPLDRCRALTIGVAGLARVARASPLGRRLAAGSLRWLAWAPLRYRRLSFPLWDLVPALDACALLPHDEERRRLALVGRGRLVDDASAPERVCLGALDGRAALDAFVSLMRS